jgi:hypothetical protein
MNWILFKKEADHTYYFWNSRHVICVQATGGETLADNVWMEDHSQPFIGLLVSRSRIFKIKKTRYVIMGRFFDPGNAEEGD